MRPCSFTDEISPDFEEAVRVCAEEGVRDVEVRSAWGKNIASMDDDEVDRMVGILRRYGVAVACIGSPFGKCELEGDEYVRHLPIFERLVRLADVLDTRLIRVFAFWLPTRARVPGQPVDLAARLPAIVERLRGPVEQARREGLGLSLENEETTWVGTSREARMLVEAIDSPALRVCWDPANGWQAGEPILPDGYEQVRGLVSHVHVRDALPDPSDPARHGPISRLGEGAIDWAELVRRLRADGFAGCLSLETHLYSGDPDRWTKLRAATVHGMSELRRLLVNEEPA
jgi:sugar phosphate isomerase/epimerase